MNTIPAVTVEPLRRRRSAVEAAQRELNDILGRVQSDAEFHRSVDERLALSAAKPKPVKRKVSAMRSLYSQL